MKNLLIVLFLVHGCHLSQAQNWMPVSEIKAGTAKTVYMNKADCEKLGECIDVTGKDLQVSKIQTEEVDDTTKPLYSSKKEILTCEGEKDCYEKLANQKCSEGSAFIDQGFTEVYCAQITGFEKKEVEVLKEDADLKSEKIAKSIKQDQLNAWYEAGVKDIKPGQKIIAIIAGYLKSKKLDKSQAQALIQGFQPIIAFASVGRLDLVKEAIEAYKADAIFTQEAKDLFIMELEGYGY